MVLTDEVLYGAVTQYGHVNYLIMKLRPVNTLVNMIHATNIQRLTNLDFDSYRALPQYSFSFLKRERNGVAADLDPTPKIAMGKLVDGILCEPATVDMSHSLYRPAKVIAHSLQQKFGNLIQHFDKQVSYTGLFQHSGFELPTKGRPDFELPKIAIVDLKVTDAKKIQPVIDYMMYWSQTWGYAKLGGCSKRYLMVYSKPNKEAVLLANPMTESDPFWEEKIIRFGWPMGVARQHT
jgi:hypothetical protein